MDGGRPYTFILDPQGHRRNPERDHIGYSLMDDRRRNARIDGLSVPQPSRSVSSTNAVNAIDDPPNPLFHEIPDSVVRTLPATAALEQGLPNLSGQAWSNVPESVLDNDHNCRSLGWPIDMYDTALHSQQNYTQGIEDMNPVMNPECMMASSNFASDMGFMPQSASALDPFSINAVHDTDLMRSRGPKTSHEDQLQGDNSWTSQKSFHVDDAWDDRSDAPAPPSQEQDLYLESMQPMHVEDQRIQLSTIGQAAALESASGFSQPKFHEQSSTMMPRDILPKWNMRRWLREEEAPVPVATAAGFDQFPRQQRTPSGQQVVQDSHRDRQDFSTWPSRIRAPPRHTPNEYMTPQEYDARVQHAPHMPEDVEEASSDCANVSVSPMGSRFLDGLRHCRMNSGFPGTQAPLAGNSLLDFNLPTDATLPLTPLVGSLSHNSLLVPAPVPATAVRRRRATKPPGTATRRSYTPSERIRVAHKRKNGLVCANHREKKVKVWRPPVAI